MGVAEAFSCKICESLLFEPVTLNCGHTSCKPCALRWKDACGTPFRSPCCNLIVPPEFPVNRKMEKKIAALYPDQLAERRREEEEEEQEEEEEEERQDESQHEDEPETFAQ